MRLGIWGISFIALTAFAAAPLSFADDTNQATSQDQASGQNNSGAHGTWDEAVDRATKALMNLAELNVPGALFNGYKAYGHYLNHNQLKDLEARTNANSGIMNSMPGKTEFGGNVNTAAAFTQPGAGASHITGWNDEVQYKPMATMQHFDAPNSATMAEFEKKTGMKREELVKNINQLVGEIARTDLPLEEQGMLIERHYDRFAASIPNKEFGDKLETVKKMLPLPVRLSFLSHLLGQRDESKLAARPAAPASKMESLVVPAAPAPASVAAAETAPEATAPAAAAAPAPEEVLDPRGDRLAHGELFGLGGKPEKELGSLLEESDDASLFKRVTARYRTLTPMLAPPAKVTWN